MTSEEIAWAAGLFEGEGCATVSNGRPRLVLRMTDEESVRRFGDTVGIGRVYGPYTYPGKSPIWVWLCDRPADSIALADDLWGWLSVARRASIARAFIEHAFHVETSRAVA